MPVLVWKIKLIRLVEIVESTFISLELGDEEMTWGHEEECTLSSDFCAPKTVRERTPTWMIWE